jgi:hypothetical protein
MFMNRLGILPIRTGFLIVFSILIVTYGIRAWSQPPENSAEAGKKANADSGPGLTGDKAATRQNPSTMELPLGLVQSIRHWTTDDRMRVVIQMDREAHYRKARLPNPDRFYFDVSDSKFNPGLVNATLPIGNQFLRQIRVAQNRPETVRVVLDIANGSEVNVFELRDPFRIVIDMYAEGTSVAQPGKPLQSDKEKLPGTSRAVPESASVGNGAKLDSQKPQEAGDSLESDRAANSERNASRALGLDPAQSPAEIHAGTQISRTEPEPKPEESRKTTTPIQSQETPKTPIAMEDLGNLSSQPAFAAPQESRKSSPKNFFTIHGQLRNETAFRIASPSDFSKFKSFAYAEMSGKPSPQFGYDLSTRLYYDAVYDLSHTFGPNVKDSQQWDAELRNAFVDISLGPLELRFGKQQVVWGQAVNLFFADVVNPKDLREFVLPDLDDIRIPMWTADVEFFIGDTHMEFVGIPVLDHNRLGVPGSDFSFKIPPLPSGTILNVADIKMPANNARNGVYGFRVSQLAKGWDLGAFYLYGYNYTPAYFRHIDMDPVTQIATVNVTPEITRRRTVGATFSKDIRGLVLKGEFVYDGGRSFMVTDPAEPDGVIKRNYFEYLLGLDYTFFGKLDFNYQFFQQYVFNPVDTLFQANRGTFSSIWFKTGFFDNRLEPEFFFVSSLTRADFMLRPKLNYTFNGHWRGALGVDLFGGNLDGTFGQFDNSDRLYLEMRYIF